MIWPPPYKIKKHRLAKSVKLHALSSGDLQITIPRRFNLKYLPRIIEENKTWILDKLSNFPKSPPLELPLSLMLSAFNQSWSISYMTTKEQLQIIERPHQEIVLLGDASNIQGCIKQIVNWLRQQFDPILITQLQALSNDIQLPFTRAIVRHQKTQWGSCNSKKLISLNYKLFFLPEKLVRYVMIHELCHTVHLNHSPQFWRLVESFDQNWRAHRSELKKADKFIPNWVNQD